MQWWVCVLVSLWSAISNCLYSVVHKLSTVIQLTYVDPCVAISDAEHISALGIILELGRWYQLTCCSCTLSWRYHLWHIHGTLVGTSSACLPQIPEDSHQDGSMHISSKTLNYNVSTALCIPFISAYDLDLFILQRTVDDSDEKGGGGGMQYKIHTEHKKDYFKNLFQLFSCNNDYTFSTSKTKIEKRLVCQ